MGEDGNSGLETDLGRMQPRKTLMVRARQSASSPKFCELQRKAIEETACSVKEMVFPKKL